MMIGHRTALALAVCALLTTACSGAHGLTIERSPAGSTITPSPAPARTPARSPSAVPPATPPAVTVTPPVSSPRPSASAGIAAAWESISSEGGAPSPREDHTWTVDGSGSVAYLFGGRSADGPQDDLWTFDLVSRTWSEVQITVDLPVPAPRFGHTATWVPEVGLVVWSGQGSSGFFDDIWAYDPTANAWDQLPSSGAIPVARYGSCASLGPDGQLWISHGFTEDSGRFADTRSYDFAAGTWTDRTPRGPVPVKRCLHDCFWSSDGRLILYGGQTTGVPAIGDLWSFDPGTGAWTEAADPAAPPRQLYGLATDGDAAIVFGGGSVERGYLDDTWRLDPSAHTLSRIDAGTAPSARSGTALITVPGSTDDILLFGGQGPDGLLGDSWRLPGVL